PGLGICSTISLFSVIGSFIASGFEEIGIASHPFFMLFDIFSGDCDDSLSLTTLSVVGNSFTWKMQSLGALTFAMLQEVHRLMTSSISEWWNRGIFPFLVSFFINVAPGCPSALCHIWMFSNVIFILIIFGVPSIFGKYACLLMSSPF